MLADITRQTRITNPEVGTINMSEGEAMMTIVHEKNIRIFNFGKSIPNQLKHLSVEVIETKLVPTNNLDFCYYMSDDQIELFKRYPRSLLVDG